MFLNNTLKYNIKKAYDLRGSNITAKDSYLIGKGFGSCLKENDKKNLVIGYDRRLNSRKFAKNFIKGVLESGINVVCVNETTTGCVQIAQILLKCDASVVVTASHNPANYHGFKFFIGQEAFSGENLSYMIEKILAHKFVHSKTCGKLKYVDFYADYIEKLEEVLKEEEFCKSNNLTICWDLMNSPIANFFHKITAFFPAKHYVLNFQSDPEFSGYAPDPTYEPRMIKLQKLIKEKKADIGIAFDGDCDRIVLFTENQEMIAGDKLLGLFLYFKNVLTQYDSKCVWDSKSSVKIIEACNGFSKSFISLIGHSNMHAAIKENNADIAGEFSGHYVFKDWFYANDGLFAVLKFLQYFILMKKKIKNYSLTKALEFFPEVYSFQESIICSGELKEEIMNKIQIIMDRKLLTYTKFDGFKIIYPYGWILIRSSNTENKIRISAEVASQNFLITLKEEIDSIVSYL